MIEKLKEKLPKHIITKHTNANLYIADFKHYVSYYGIKKYEGKVVILNTEPTDWKCVHLTNKNKIEICFDGFEDNALPKSKNGEYSKQCECVIFPSILNDDYWILFVETKYTNSLENAIKKENNYPKCMIEQIIETIKYFRNNEIISPDKKVHAILSFPTLVEEFNSFIFCGDLSIDNILTEHKIVIRGTNKAQIISNKRIKIW